ncbi:hypothetical protein NA56DRAFT_566863 [Hyaloscypha hepaticicola]|uniref:VWFA domain-containing protein n=1 Tax=Hyaloscypha hepaticicola TaxID=2082293 RepID=A0A2J6QE69_9HELO|nr:hypothetical protein NA56DRAFT_566863 [Hyaloscypha hepaticicola]
MSNGSTTVIGCLLDVSGSMRKALESGRSDERAIERLRAVLGAGLKIAQAEHRRDPHALMFVGVFGLRSKCPPAVDLCGVIEMLLSGHQDHRTGHDLLIALANRNNLKHITQYIRTKLTDDEARIVNMYLRRHPERVAKFVNAIPPPKTIRALAHRICDEWLQEFATLVPRPIADVVQLLQRLQEHPAAGGGGGSNDSNALLDMLRQYMYGWTPMREALSLSLDVFRKQPNAERRVLVLISDGHSTDGDPLPIAPKLQQANITLAAIYLTSNRGVTRRRLYDRAVEGWNVGQRTLFDMVAKVACATHPIPALASMGWDVPSSGECALYATVCSVEALDEFCSLLLSARFGSADALLDIIGRVQVDAFIDDKFVRTCNDPSDQGNSSTCYAHATAAVLHMSLLRIVGREGGCLSIETIRKRILKEFPAKAGGQNVKQVLTAATAWYRLRFREVDEEGARQAVLRRRPVLTTFRLSSSGWDKFCEHFEETAATRCSTLTRDHMAPHRSGPDGGGHAVVLYSCDPHSLTFLNSWGLKWGKDGSFSIEDHTVLELNSAPVCFYDVYWLESDLTEVERQAYDTEVYESLRARSVEHPSILELEARCPLCCANAPIADFRGNIRQAVCPHCNQSFTAEPGHLVQALYTRAGLGDAT